MTFKHVLLKRPCPQIGANTVLIKNDEKTNGVFCTATGGIYINSNKSEDYIYIPPHNISFVAFEIVKPEPTPEPTLKVVPKDKVATKPKLASVKESGTGNKTDSREVSKARAPARKSTRSTKTTRKTPAKNN